MLDEIDGDVRGHEMRRHVLPVLLLLQEFLLRLLSGLDVLNFGLDAQVHLRNPAQHLVGQHLLRPVCGAHAEMLRYRIQGRVLGTHVLSGVLLLLLIVSRTLFLQLLLDVLHHLLVLVAFVGLCRELRSDSRIERVVIVLLELARFDGLHVDHATGLDVEHIFLEGNGRELQGF